MKRLLLILSLVCFAISTWAGQITRNQALLKAQQFFSQKGLPSSLTSAETHASRHRAQGAMQPDYYYVFNAGPDQGFVIVSGDDRAETVLGYATSGNFDVDNIPPAMADLLNYYAAQIEAIQQGALVATRSVSHPQVAELMTVKWNQGEPYNNKTPLGYYSNLNDGFHCLTGCVATAMAQVLYHQRFVNATQATIPGYQNYYYWKPPSGDKYAYLADIPSGSALEWDKMVDNYEAQTTTQDQKDAVANLMLYCGTAVNMQYNLPEGGGSSASVSDIPDVFKKYFVYSRGTRYVSRDNYSDSDWDNLIYNEIASGRPVIYGGQTAKNEGHAFVVHGYDGNGNYAINWGWGGYQDNYFYLSDLTPKSQGMGGGSGGYNYGQEAVIYLTKEDGTFKEDVIATVFGAAVGDVNFDNFVIPTGQSYQASRNSKGGCVLGLAFTYTSDLANVYAFDLGYGIQDSDGNLMGDVVTLRQKWDLTQGQTRTTATGTSNFAPGISEGTYYIKAYSCENGTTDWSVCKDADKFAIKMVVSSSTMKFEVVDISTPDPEPQPEVSQADLKALEESYDKLKADLAAKQQLLTENKNTIASLEGDIKKAKDAIDPIEKKIAEIKESLNNDILSADKKASFQRELDAFDKVKSTYADDLNTLEAKLATAKKSNEELKANLEKIAKLIDSQIEAIKNISTDDELSKAKTDKQDAESQLGKVDPDAVGNVLHSLRTELEALDFDGIAMALESLESVIQQVIAQAIAIDEYEKQQAEKLAKAKEDCQSALDKLGNTIETHQSYFDQLKEAHETVKAKMKELDDVLAQLKIQYADIEEMLNDLIAKQTSNQYADKIGKLQDSLMNLADNIAKLENQRQIISGQIEQLEDPMLRYDLQIQKAIDISNQLPVLLASATDIADVETMTELATNESNALSSNGVDDYNQFVDYYSMVVNNLNIYINNVIIVGNQAESLENDVNETITGIGNVIVDDSEILGRYDMKGNRVDSTYKGVQIIRLKNGKSIKINVK